jgi:hypothetical protein
VEVHASGRTDLIPSDCRRVQSDSVAVDVPLMCRSTGDINQKPNSTSDKDSGRPVTGRGLGLPGPRKEGRKECVNRGGP